ncbi:MAG: DNA-binding response regulator [Bacteroidia bacterium]|nr:MAG: DNA-binding response regulator [Bacteroidia bacterium]
MPNNSINVLVVDDHQLIIEGLKSLLEYEHDILFCAGANSIREAMDYLAQQPVDVVLMDINMPGESGIQAAKMIKAHYPNIKTLALTMHDDISIITRMIEAGAAGYILKRTNMNEVIDAIRIVHTKGRYLGVDAQRIIMDNMGISLNQSALTEGKKPLLTAREREVLSLITKEYNNEAIANELFISQRTVEAHRRNIFFKTKTKSIVGLIKYAILNGLIDQDPETDAETNQNR